MRSITRFPKASLALVLFATVTAVSVATAAENKVDYTIAVSPDDHLLHVRVKLPPGPSERDLQLPVWNALYQVREFSQFVSAVHASGPSPEGAPEMLEQINPSEWRIRRCEHGATVDYEVYADSEGPFGAQLNAHHAFLNLAQILMYTPDTRNFPITLRFQKLPGWKVAIPLPYDGYEVRADNYDRLVDSPVELGDFRELDFDESGGLYHVVVDADPADYDMAKLVDALHKIVIAATTWMNDRPYDTYTFFYHFPHGPAGGGMEHAYSTAIELNADSIKTSLYPFNAVTAHEFFHLWNVKRIRPRTLDPVDYTKENPTRALWFSEGVTSTVENIIELRAGLIHERQYLGELGGEISELERRPAHLTQSAEDSSLDAWLEGNNYYRRPERSISYYNKGELLGVMLDLAVRQASHDHASLREVLQWMNTNYAKKGRYFDDSNGVREAAEAVSHADLGWFFTKYVSGTEEIPWDDFFRPVGLRVVKIETPVADPGFSATRNFDGPMTVGSVTAGSEAEKAGLQVGDTILELQGKTAGQDSRQTLASLKPGDTLTIKVRSRRAGERDLSWKVGSRQEVSYDVENLDQVTPEQHARREAWLKGEARGEAQSTDGTTVKGDNSQSESSGIPSGVN